MEHGSERKEVGDEAGRRRACEIFIVASCELCCPEEAFNWDFYDVVIYKWINYITIMIQNLARYVSKPLCSVVPNAKNSKNKSMQQKGKRSIKYFSVIWKAHSQTFIEEQSSAESLNLSSCRKLLLFYHAVWKKKNLSHSDLYLLLLSLERDHVSQTVVQQMVHTKFWFFFSAAARANHWDISFPIAKDEKIQAHFFTWQTP